MSILEFMSDSPMLTFFISFMSIHAVWLIVNRFFRMLNIMKNGYPPEHCDADGDFRSEDDN